MHLFLSWMLSINCDYTIVSFKWHVTTLSSLLVRDSWYFQPLRDSVGVWLSKIDYVRNQSKAKPVGTIPQHYNTLIACNIFERVRVVEQSIKTYYKPSAWSYPQSRVCVRYCFNIVNKPLNGEIVYGQKRSYVHI